VDFIYVRANLFLPLVLVAFLLCVPVIYESHRKPMTSGEISRDKILSRLVTGIVVISEYLKSYYEQYGKKVAVAHDAVSLESFNDSLGREKARNLLRLPQEKRIVVYSGTVSNLKGIPYVVSAAKVLPDVDFLLAGIIAQEFRNIELPKNMKLLGRKDQKEIPTLLQAADVLLLPHPKGEYSQSPMKLFEYMASGVPIVASKLPSLCEVLNDSNAVLVEPENPDSLVGGIEKVFSDRANAQTLAAQARGDVNEYTWEKRGGMIAAFIRAELNK
jgi:glycosyltransferase involved in cell wall biosynthesis